MQSEYFFVISFLTTLFSIIMPYYNGLFIDAILEKPLLENVIYFAIVIGVLSIVAILINYIYGIVVIKIKLEMFVYLYLDIMQHLQKIPLLILNKYNPSYLNRRINDDITAVWEFFLVRANVSCQSVIFNMHRCHLSIYDFSKRIGISKFGLTDNIEKRIIIIRGGISHTNACVGGVGNGSDERLCCPSG